MRIVFMGTPESAALSLGRLVEDGHEIAAVYTQPDRPAGRGKKLHQSPVKELASRHNLRVLQPLKIKTEEAKEVFASHQADVAVVVAYGRILPSHFLTTPRLGCVNLHFSLLPKYRGAAPVNWAIVNGEHETGVTTMKIVEELDAGPILLQGRTTIGEDETAPQLMARLAEMGAELLSETIQRIEDLKAIPQAHEQATFAPILAREDGLIDWSMPAVAIARRIRGFQPWPNAFTTLNSRRLILKVATSESAPSMSKVPGEIITAHGETLLIGCGEDSALRVLELQPEDSRRMTARDFLNGSHLQVGQILGQS
jgi:methionyl-tRNA formyltransferase